MSHHGSDPSDEQRRRMAELLNTTSFRGALGDFPHGKIAKDDEGSIQFAISERDGKVVMDFGKEVAWIGMNPQDAADLASSLLKFARLAGRKSGQPVGFTI